MEETKGRGVILFPLPFQGHINPMLQLASILHSKGFSITIIHTHFNSPNPSNYPHFTFYSIPDGLARNQFISSDENELISFITTLNTNCVNPFRDCLSKLLSEAKDEHSIVCLVTDELWYSTQAVADGFKLPRMALRTTSVSAFHVLTSFPLLLERGYGSLQGLSEAESLVPELPPFRIKDLFSSETNYSESLIQYVTAVAQGIKSSSGLIFNSCQDLEQQTVTKCSREFPVPIFAIGPFHKYFPASSSSLLPQDRSCISWLDKQAPNSVIYASFGSVTDMNESEFLEVALGLANSNQPFLWVVRPSLVNGSKWLELLPKGFLEMVGGRAHIVKWAPQQEVLAHPSIGVFWTHCGWNSTLESLCEGVPMICQPFFGDQKVNARYVSDVWKVGLHLENKIERGEIEKAIRRLMVEGEGQEIRDRAKSVKENINLCVKPSGSSYKALDTLVTRMLTFK